MQHELHSATTRLLELQEAATAAASEWAQLAAPGASTAAAPLPAAGR